MSNTLDISVIVPVYKAGFALRSLFDSLCYQTFDNNRYEIIAVDDSSKDDSGAICDEYAAKFNNFCVIHREVNSGGPCEPRNDGLRVARGEYIIFADADDWFGQEALERLYNHAKEWDSEYVFGRAMKANRTTITPWVAFLKKNTGNLVNLNIRDNYEICASWGPWARLIKRSVLLDNNIFFDTSIPFYEDQIWNIELLRVAKCPCVANDYDYYFVRRDKGWQSWSTSGVGGAHKRPEVMCRAIDKILTVIEKDEENLDESSVFWKKLFYLPFRESFLWIDTAVHYEKERYPDQGKEFKDIIWNRIKPYYSSTVRKTLGLEHVCNYDAIAAGLGYNHDNPIVFYAGLPMRDGKCLSAIESLNTTGIEMDNRLYYLSEEAKKRLFAVQATNYEAYADYSQKCTDGIIRGDLFAPLFVTDVFSFELLVGASRQECLASAGSLTIVPYSWGEDYQMRAKWHAVLPEGIDLPLQSGSLTLLISLQGQKVYEVTVNPWDAESGRSSVKS